MIDIKNLKVEKNYSEYNSLNIAGLSDRLVDKAKNCSIVINTNSLEVDLIKSMLKYRKNINYQWKKGYSTDSLFLRIYGKNHDIIAFLKKYNDNLIGLTYQEKKQLDKIRKNSYITKKYNFSDEITIEDEIDLFKVYLPSEQVDSYNDYDNIKNQSVFYNKRINYEKTEKNIQIIDITLNHCIDMLDDFKLSDLNVDLSNGIPFMEIFHKRIKACEYRLKRNYWRVKDRYTDYDEFIKAIVCYGAIHTKNNKYWQIIKRELY